MTTTHEFFEWLGVVAGDLAVVGVIGAWWHELFANDAHVFGLGIILGIGVFRLIQTYFTARWAMWRWRHRDDKP